MRLKSVFISDYKNLKDFYLDFESDSFIDIFVGKNGTGKSNLFEALLEIFRHIVEYDSTKAAPDFDCRISYEKDGKNTEIAWDTGNLKINNKLRKTISQTPLPDNILIYYSGHNNTVATMVEQYETDFRSRIKGAEFDESRYFIGIGPEYKELLLAVILMQPDGNKAREFICKKLSIEKLGLAMPGTKERSDPVVRLMLERPEYAKGSNKTNYDIENNDTENRYWKPEGITKLFLERLSNCINREPGGVTVSEGYFPSEEKYILYLDIEKVQQEFNEYSAQELFRHFDNLKTLGMLTEITIPLQLAGDIDANITHFSDGQFQSVYIYSIVEIFKDRNCITLLDEPDSFLHPEWQFEFLQQIEDISEAASKNNHLLVSSHSASTIANINLPEIRHFESDGKKVAVNNVEKAEVIKSLSSGLISFSEGEARLNISHILNNTTGPILFTEGITDEMILETAWGKLYPAEEREFEIQNAFDCGFMCNLMKRDTIYQNHPGRVFFSLFDFDEAYNHWCQLGTDVLNDPHQCLVKKRNNVESYAILLPVPTNGAMQQQVINPNTGGTYGNKSLLTIELLFHGLAALDDYFIIDAERTDSFIKFSGNKVRFAKEVVPNLDSQHFEIFRPLFEFVKSKCPGAVAAAV